MDLRMDAEKICPCKGCSDRKLDCHDKCERYKTWKAEIDRIVVNERSIKQKDRLARRLFKK